MGRRSRRRAAEGGGPGAGSAGSFADLGLDLDLSAPEAEAAHDLGDGAQLVLRTTMTLGTRAEYTAVVKGERSSPAATAEDAWQRAVEFLFERLAVRWSVAGVTTEGQRALLARLRAATRAERAAVRTALRAHLAEHFADLDAP